MTHHVEITHVAAVLIGDRWHEIQNESFDVQPYQYTRDGKVLLFDGRHDPPPGYSFTERVAGELVVCAGPLSSISALRLRPEESE